MTDAAVLTRDRAEALVEEVERVFGAADVETGRRMRGHGVEVWQMAGERIAVWEAAFNVWPDGGSPATPIV